MEEDRGFTFVELMVVLTIIGILVSIAVPNFLEARIRSQFSRARSELALLKMGIEAYRLEHRAYPPNRLPGKADVEALVALTTPVAFLARLPIDALLSPEDRSQARHPQLRVLPYRYFNALAVAPEAGLQLDPVWLGFEGFRAGMIWGAGPSLDLRLNESGAPIELSTDGRASFVPYDPTNGTISKGIIPLAIP